MVKGRPARAGGLCDSRSRRDVETKQQFGSYKGSDTAGINRCARAECAGELVLKRCSGELIDEDLAGSVGRVVYRDGVGAGASRNCLEHLAVERSRIACT
jgi:hypothetical protein